MPSADKNLEKLLTKLLEKAAQELHLSSYTINLKLEANRGDGFMGELYKVSLTDNTTQEEIHLVVKKAPTLDPEERKSKNIREVYLNEIYFYSTIMPALQQFQKDAGISDVFNLIPHYLASSSNELEEAIVFEDITKKGFILLEKDLLLDVEQAEAVFATYGKFHGLSMAFKLQRPEEFKQLVAPLVNMYTKLTESGKMTTFIDEVLRKLVNNLDPEEHSEVISQIEERHFGQVSRNIVENTSYQGGFSTILHGDCWSNNIMFKYRDNESKFKLESMNLLDFQLSFVGSPVHDLSYFFYTGGSKKLYDNWEHYLDIYCENFSKTVKELGVENCEKLLTREKLISDWKKYAKSGIYMSLLLTQIKLLSKEDSIEIAKSQGKFKTAKFNNELFLQRATEIVLHASRVGAL